MIRQCRSSTWAIFFRITRGGTAMGDKTRTRYQTAQRTQSNDLESARQNQRFSATQLETVFGTVYRRRHSQDTGVLRLVIKST
jgi:hypothetical protein